MPFIKNWKKSYPKEFKRFPMDFIVSAYANTPLAITAICNKHQVSFSSSAPLEKAKTAPSTKEAVVQQLSRLTDTVYELGSIDYYADDVFIPVKLLNEARRINESGTFKKKLSNTKAFLYPTNILSIKGACFGCICYN